MQNIKKIWYIQEGLGDLGNQGDPGPELQNVWEIQKILDTQEVWEILENPWNPRDSSHSQKMVRIVSRTKSFYIFFTEKSLMMKVKCFPSFFLVTRICFYVVLEYCYSSLCCCYWLSWHPQEKVFFMLFSKKRGGVLSCNFFSTLLCTTDGQRLFIQEMCNMSQRTGFRMNQKYSIVEK